MHLSYPFYYRLFLPGSIVGLCVAGFWCQAGSPSPSPNLTSTEVTKAGPCPPGFYCPFHTVELSPCPNATFKNYYGGNGNVEDCFPCPAGQQCFEGTFSIRVE